METGKVVGGGVVLAVGLFVLVMGLSPEMTCSIIVAVGGQCGVIFGRLAVEDSYRIVPPLILDLGAILTLIGGGLSVLGALRKGEGAGPVVGPGMRGTGDGMVSEIASARNN